MVIPPVETQQRAANSSFQVFLFLLFFNLKRGLELPAGFTPNILELFFKLVTPSFLRRVHLQNDEPVCEVLARRRLFFIFGQYCAENLILDVPVQREREGETQETNFQSDERDRGAFDSFDGWAAVSEGM